MSKAFQIANKARTDISDFCINSCKAKCCRVGKLLMQNKSEVDAIIPPNRQDSLVKKKILEKTEIGNTTLNLDKKQCPNLSKSNLCSIHKDSKRPVICSDYPIFFVKNYFMFSPACTAVQQGLLDKYIIEIEREGYRYLD